MPAGGVTFSNPAAVYRVDPTTGASTVVYSAPANSNEVFGDMAVLPDGELYLTGFNGFQNSLAVRINPNTQSVVTLPTTATVGYLGISDVPPTLAIGGAGDLSAKMDSTGIVPSKATDLHLTQVYGGEQLNVPVSIVNNTDSAVTGKVKVEVFLSTDSKSTQGTALYSTTATLNKLAAGDSFSVKNVTVTLDPKKIDFDDAGTTYYFVVKITPQGDLAKNDNPDDDVKGTDKGFEYVGTPSFSAAFPTTYFNFIRDTLNNNTSKFGGFDLTDAKSFIRHFEGDKLNPYKDSKGIATISVGINLTTLDPTIKSMLVQDISTNRSDPTFPSFHVLAALFPTQFSDGQIVNQLIHIAQSEQQITVLTQAQSKALFAAEFAVKQTDTNDELQGFGVSVPAPNLENIVYMDQEYNVGYVFPGMTSAIVSGDYAIAGFELVDSKRTTEGMSPQSPGLLKRVEAEFYDLMSSHMNALGEIM
jgi:hypothetical protein